MEEWRSVFESQQLHMGEMENIMHAVASAESGGGNRSSKDLLGVTWLVLVQSLQLYL